MQYVSVTKLGGIISTDWAFGKFSTEVDMMGLKTGKIEEGYI